MLRTERHTNDILEHDWWGNACVAGQPASPVCRFGLPVASVPCLSSQRKQHAAPKGSRRSNGSPLQSLAELLAPMQPGEARRVGTLQATVAGVEGGGSQGIGRVRLFWDAGAGCARGRAARSKKTPGQ